MRDFKDGCRKYSKCETQRSSVHRRPFKYLQLKEDFSMTLIYYTAFEGT